MISSITPEPGLRLAQQPVRGAAELVAVGAWAAQVGPEVARWRPPDVIVIVPTLVAAALAQPIDHSACATMLLNGSPYKVADR